MFVLEQFHVMHARPTIKMTLVIRHQPYCCHKKKRRNDVIKSRIKDIKNILRADTLARAPSHTPTWQIRVRREGGGEREKMCDCAIRVIFISTAGE